MKTNKDIITLIKPETELENKILNDSEIIEGLLWGKPRNGHPEGQVLSHVSDVLKNIDSLDIKGENREKLRIIAIIHDSFKYKVDRTKPKTGENHHAMIARRFAEKYITDNEILEVIELHDDAYNSYQKYMKDKDAGIKRAKKLVERLGEYHPLYLAFYKCDNSTGNKTGEDYNWFLQF